MEAKRPWLEWGKDALIVLLTLSAVYLLTMTPLVQDSGLLELLRPKPAAGAAQTGAAQTGAVLPARLAVCRNGQRFGLQYNEERMSAQFAALSPLLGDALAGAGQGAELTEEGWRGRLQRTGAYFDFAGDVPLAALGGWLGGECALEGSARRVLLCAGEGDQVELCWQDADSGGFFSCPTTLSSTLHLAQVVDGVNANGAYFAFEDPELARLLAPYTLITEGQRTGVQYTASMPLSGAGETEAMLDALSFNSRNHAPGSRGEVYLDGTDRLVVADGGTVTYRAAQGGKYPVGTGGHATAAEAADMARALAERAMGALCGDARLYLISVQPHGEGGWQVRFGYRLNGSAVYLYDEGWAAEFLVQDGFITEFVLHLRCYTASGGSTLLLPVDKAAVMLPDLGGEGHELVIQYRDGGGDSLSPSWEAV